MSDTFKEELNVLLKAKFPIIIIETFEEKRVIPQIYQVALAREWETHIWTVTNEFETMIGEKYPDDVKKKDMPLNNLFNEMLSNPEKKELFILKDVNALFTDDQPINIRKLRDVALRLPKMYKAVIILSPVFKIPYELEKNVVLLDFSLPTVQELENVLMEILNSASLGNELQKLPVTIKEQILNASLGLTASEAENVFSKALVINKGLNEKMIDTVVEEKKQIIRKTGILEFIPAAESFKDVGGMSRLKNWLFKRQNDFSEEAHQFGLPNPKGILLLGVPGCGKSLIAKSIGAQWHLPMLRFDIGEVFSKYQGESEVNIRKVIKVSESVSPCILWIDEIEKGFAGVGGSGDLDSGTGNRIFGSFITWMQEKIKPVFIVATANKISVLPPELLRKGRFDEIFFVDLPDSKQRMEIFDIHLKKVKYEFSIDELKILSKVSRGFSGAEIEQAVISGLHDAFHSDKRKLTVNDIVTAIKDTVPLSITMKQEIDNMRAWAKVRAVNASEKYFDEILPSDARRSQF